MEENFVVNLSVLLVIIETSYAINIFIQSSLAFDVSGEGIYEIRWKKTSQKFWNSNEFKVMVFNLVPWGALGYIEGTEFLRVLWLIKLVRFRLFRRIFSYQTYSKFFRTIFHIRLRASIE